MSRERIDGDLPEWLTAGRDAKYRQRWMGALKDRGGLRMHTIGFAVMWSLEGNPDGTHIYPNQEDFAKRRGITSRTIRRSLAEIVAGGWLYQVHEASGARGDNDGYWLSTPQAVERPSGDEVPDVAHVESRTDATIKSMAVPVESQANGWTELAAQLAVKARKEGFLALTENERKLVHEYHPEVVDELLPAFD